MSNSINIAEQGLLVSLSISLWTGRKHDKDVSAEVAQNHGATKIADDIGRYNKVLISRHESKTFESLEKLRNESRQRYYEVTLPIGIGENQILAAAGYFDFQQEFSSLQSRYNALADTFETEYPTILQAAKVRLNGLFDLADYPKQCEVRRRFSFGYQFLPIPDAAQLSVPSIGQEAEEAIRKQVAESMQAELARAARDPWERVYAICRATADKLGKFDPDAKGKDRGAFRDSLIGNINDLAQILPRLNLTGDPELNAMADRLTAELCEFDADRLRDDGAARAAVATRAANIASMMAGYGVAS